MKRKIGLIISLSLIFILVSCNIKSEKIDISYYNHQDYLEIDYIPYEKDGQKSVEVEVTLKNSKDKFDKLEISLDIIQTSQIPTTHNHDIVNNVDFIISPTSKKTVSKTYKISMFNTIKDVKLSSIKGTIITKVDGSTTKKGAKVYKKLKSEIEKFNDFKSVTIDLLVKVNDLEVTTKSGINTNPFQYYMLVNNTDGIVIENKNNDFLLYQVFRHDLITSYKLLAKEKSIENLDVDLELKIDEFNENWDYKYKNNKYIITADVKSIIELIIDDEELIDEIFRYEVKEEVTLTIEILGNEVNYDIDMSTAEGEFLIETKYTFNDNNYLDITKYTETAPSEENLVNELSQYNNKIFFQTIFPEISNYYKYDLPRGYYILDVSDNRLETEILDSNNKIVKPVKNTIYKMFAKEIYYLEGNYTVKINNYTGTTRRYNMEMININEKYNSVVNTDESTPKIIDNSTIKIEHIDRNDLKIYNFYSEKQTILKMKTDSAYKGKIYLYEIGDQYYSDLEKAEILNEDNTSFSIFLNKGNNFLIFHSEYKEEINFEFNTFGQTQESPEDLPKEYNDYFLLTHNNNSIYYNIELNKDSTIKLFMEYSENVIVPTNGFSYQILIKDPLPGQSNIYKTFYMKNEEEIHLEKGSYQLRIYGQKEIKVKGQILNK